MDRNRNCIKPQTIDYNVASKTTSTSSSSWHLFAHFLHYKTKVKRFKPTHNFSTTFRHMLSFSLSTFQNDNTWNVKEWERERTKGGTTKFAFEKPWRRGYFLICHHHPCWHNFHLPESSHHHQDSCNCNIHVSSSFSTKIFIWASGFTCATIVPRLMQGKPIVHITTLSVTLLLCFIFQITNTSPAMTFAYSISSTRCFASLMGGFPANVVVLNVDLSLRFTFDIWTIRAPHLIKNFSPKFKSPSNKIIGL
jgi:hypothetical protein